MLSLPLVTLTWTSDDSIVAAGHDCQPLFFSGSEVGWQKIGSLDDTTAPKSAEPGRPGFGSNSSVGRLKAGAFATFRDADSRGQSSISGSGISTESKLLTVHQNTITSVRAYEAHGGRVTRVSSSGVDGKLVIWEANAVATGGVSALSARLGSAHLK
jgi:actin related protein 2/3 complex subunit 1A/1B